ncbi:MAG: hypothetical protein WD749_15465 [Phycisphaerales bacterium]
MNCVAFAAVLAVGSGLGAFFYLRHQDELQLREVSSGLRRFEQVLAFRGASKETETTERGWPLTVEPTWFESDIPRNQLVTPDRPWLEIATPDQATMMDPPLRIAIGTTTAAFWYNPYKGIIRARVPIAISDRKALDLYNKVNGTALDNIYCAEGVLLPELMERPQADQPPADPAAPPVPEMSTQTAAEAPEAPQP